MDLLQVSGENTCWLTKSTSLQLTKNKVGGQKWTERNGCDSLFPPFCLSEAFLCIVPWFRFFVYLLPILCVSPLFHAVFYLYFSCLVGSAVIQPFFSDLTSYIWEASAPGVCCWKQQNFWCHVTPWSSWLFNWQQAAIAGRPVWIINPSTTGK